jgi:hypothetical protein
MTVDKIAVELSKWRWMCRHIQCHQESVKKGERRHSLFVKVSKLFTQRIDGFFVKIRGTCCTHSDGQHARVDKM